ncbi:preprotein translocase subunit YajC [bacterium]|nr:preprotein translocase subunit YajC [FCB group bacterium]MBL7190286.1 preprotein translocase subunit YajC [bacterium]
MYLHFIAMSQPQGGAEGGGGLGILGLLPWILIIVVFYFLLIRPQARRQKQHQEMLKSVRKGDKIVTSGGIHGEVLGVKENLLKVKIADKVIVDIERSAIGRVIPDPGAFEEGKEES